MEKIKNSLNSINEFLTGFRSLVWIVVFCLVSVVIYILLLIWPNLLNYLWLSRDHPWGILTSIFTHVELGHLIGNILVFFIGLFLFTLVSQSENIKLRNRWSWGLVMVSFLAGIGANILEYVIGLTRPIGQSWGASGVVYAVLGVITAKSLLSAPTGLHNLANMVSNRGHKKHRPISLEQKRKMGEIQSNITSIFFVIAIIGLIIISPAGFLSVAPHVDVLAHGIGFFMGFLGFWLLFVRDSISKRNH